MQGVDQRPEIRLLKTDSSTDVLSQTEGVTGCSVCCTTIVSASRAAILAHARLSSSSQSSSAIVAEDDAVGASPESLFQSFTVVLRAAARERNAGCWSMAGGGATTTGLEGGLEKVDDDAEVEVRRVEQE